MHSYQHNIKTFNNATRHLTRVERCLYRDLIELYYDTEQPLPADDFDRLSRKVLAHSADEKAALRYVLDEFFVLTGDVYTHDYCDSVIETYQRTLSAKATAGKASAASRRKKADARKQQRIAKAEQKGAGVEQVLDSAATPVRNQKPETINHKPIKNIPSTSVDGDCDENQSDDSPPEKPKASKYKFTDEQYQLAVALSCPSKARFGVNFKINLDEWADTVRKLNEIDGHQLRDIERLWRWVVNHTMQSGSFAGWADNCRTPMKLRQRKDGLAYFDIITTQMHREVSYASNRSEQTSASHRQQGRESLVDRVERKSEEWLRQRQAGDSQQGRDIDGEVVADDESSLRLQVRQPVR